MESLIFTYTFVIALFFPFLVHTMMQQNKNMVYKSCFVVIRNSKRCRVRFEKKDFLYFSSLESFEKYINCIKQNFFLFQTMHIVYCFCQPLLTVKVKGHSTKKIRFPEPNIIHKPNIRLPTTIHANTNICVFA